MGSYLGRPWGGVTCSLIRKSTVQWWNNTAVLGVRSNMCFPVDGCCTSQGKACLVVLRHVLVSNYIKRITLFQTIRDIKCIRRIFYTNLTHLTVYLWVHHSVRMYSIVAELLVILRLWIPNVLSHCTHIFGLVYMNNITSVTGLLYQNTHWLILVSALTYRNSVLWTSCWTKFGTQSKMHPSHLPEHCPTTIKIMTMMMQMHMCCWPVCAQAVQHTEHGWVIFTG